MARATAIRTDNGDIVLVMTLTPLEAEAHAWYAAASADERDAAYAELCGKAPDRKLRYRGPVHAYGPVHAAQIDALTKVLEHEPTREAYLAHKRTHE